MAKRFAGTFSGRRADVLAGFIVYSQLPAGVVFCGNGGLFLKTVATEDGDHLLSFSLEDGHLLNIKPDDMVRIFSGSIAI
jgi:hypothetical protein